MILSGILFFREPHVAQQGFLVRYNIKVTITS